MSLRCQECGRERGAYGYCPTCGCDPPRLPADEMLCACGHPHVNPDGSGSCSKFTCPCRTFVRSRSGESLRTDGKTGTPRKPGSSA